jgi:[1-hydroxy-2-(trimethylamino)ethyl]phosphonate dioxygenase
MTVADDIMDLFEVRGRGAYFGEPVSVVEHGLQAARFAEDEGASSPLVVAALLHDIGHLIDWVPADIEDWHTDARHEEVGSTWLARSFDSRVTDPVRLHVAAKRYLCAASASYLAKLSPASIVTLKLQGGPMSPDEVNAFRREPRFREAVRLRLWDDRAKVEGLATAALADYRGLIESLTLKR